MKISREEAAANALEGHSRCLRCDKAHPPSLSRRPRPHLVGVIGRTAFGCLSLPDACGRTWAMAWRRIPMKEVREAGRIGTPNNATEKLRNAYGPDTELGFSLDGGFYLSWLPHGTAFVFRKHAWVAVRARSFWSRNKAREWAKRWLIARVNTRGTKHREIFDDDLEVPNVEEDAS